MSLPWHLFAMSGLYVFAGILHFIYPLTYLRIMPPYIPWPKTMVYASGLAEVLLGIGLCFGSTREFAIYSIIFLLILFLSVHLYMLSNTHAAMGLSRWILVIRIPLQFVLMYWVWTYL